jgi:hypothetical protein
MSSDTPQVYDFGFKRITEYRDDELELAIKMAVNECGDAGLDFYAVLRGVDAYQEKRRRKLVAATGGKP